MTYYWSFREAGSAHPHSLRKVMNKLLRHVHRCLRTGEVWDEARVWPNAMSLADAQAYRDECKRQTTEWRAKHPKVKDQQRPRRPRKPAPTPAPAPPIVTGAS